VGGIGVAVGGLVAVDAGVDEGLVAVDAGVDEGLVAVGGGVDEGLVAVGGISVDVESGCDAFLVMLSRMEVFEGIAVGLLFEITLAKVGVILGVAVAKNWANGFNIPPPPVSIFAVAPVFGMKKFELIISRSRENPPVSSNGTLNPRIQVKSIPADMIYTV
jgi:hypothetical protein